MTFPVPHRSTPVHCTSCGFAFLESDPEGADFCGRVECLTRREIGNPDLARARRVKEAKWLELTKRRVAPLIEEILTRLGKSAAEPPIAGIVPFVDRPLTKLSPERRTRFEASLRDAIEDSFSHSESTEVRPPAPASDPDFKHRAAIEKAEPPVLGSACAACRGDCCIPGAKRQAFIVKRTIDRFRWLHPKADREETAQFYLEALPEMSIQDSCVYHGEMGCTLPRGCRSDICNSYLCWFRKELDADYAKHSANGGIIVAIDRNHVCDPVATASCIRVVSVSDTKGVTHHADLTLPALSRAETDAFAQATASVHKKMSHDI